MTIHEVHKKTQKSQRAILRQITTRRIKIAALLTEIDDLQNALVEVPAKVDSDRLAFITAILDADNDDDLDEDEVA